ncbi:MAG: class I SAM-dependent methyltransferase [Gammaproteobacteria bacterium]|nr:class I SAM-dependent methyltransferase [Gammaproteobacteria bacterium]
MAANRAGQGEVDFARRDEVRQYWNDHVHEWAIARYGVGTKEFFEATESYRFEKLSYLSQLVNYAGFPGKRILDLGCGLGNDTARFAHNGLVVVGVDLAERSIELARKNFSIRGLPGDFSVMNGEQLGFRDNSFDLVYCHTVLHFTPNPDHMIREIHRVTKPGGLAILMMVNSRSWLRFLHRVMRTEIDHLGAPVFHWYSERRFKQLLSCFEEVRMVMERFPVRTKVHKGLKARLFNTLFVDLFNAVPRGWVRWSGHHMIVFAAKSDAA